MSAVRAVTNRRLIDSGGPDFYPTPPWGTKGLLHFEKFVGPIHEPCCGDGAMAKVLIDAGYDVVSSDAFDRGFGEPGVDLFGLDGPFENVVTNPPFNMAEEMIIHLLPRTQRKLCMLLRTAFLESSRRYGSLYREMAPARILVFSERLSMYPAGQQDVNGGGTTSYAWFVWDWDHQGETSVRWIPPGLKPKRKRELPAECEPVA